LNLGGSTRDPLNMTSANMSMGSRTGMFIMGGTAVPLMPKSRGAARQKSNGSIEEIFDGKHQVVSPHSSDKS